MAVIEFFFAVSFAALALDILAAQPHQIDNIGMSCLDSRPFGNELDQTKVDFSQVPTWSACRTLNPM